MRSIDPVEFLSPSRVNPGQSLQGLERRIRSIPSLAALLVLVPLPPIQRCWQADGESGDWFIGPSISNQV